MVARGTPALHYYVDSDRRLGCFAAFGISAPLELETAIFFSQPSLNVDTVCDILCDTIAKGGLSLFSALRASNR